MGNWEVRADGVALWDTQKGASLSFEGNSYDLNYAELEPQRIQDLKMVNVNPSTVELIIDNDPNNILP